MLKARAGDRFVFGLSARNVELLMDGKPIVIDMKDLGCDSGSVLIFYGETEGKMRNALVEAGIEIEEQPS